MTGYRQLFVIATIGIFIAPQIAFAAWWNPFTWPIFNGSQAPTISIPKQNVQTPTPVSTQSTSTLPSGRKKLSSQLNLVKLNNSQIIKKIKPATVYIETDKAVGSGMIFTTDGYILTNAHVIADATTIKITLSNNATYPATVVGQNGTADVAVLKVPGASLPTVQFGDSDSVQQGDSIFTFGFPFGLQGDVVFTNGTVARIIKSDSSPYIETTAETHPGNSGGPLVNQYGQIIGINSASYGSFIQGVQVGETIKLAIPINIAVSLIPQLKAGMNIVKQDNLPAQADTKKLCTDFLNEITTFSKVYHAWGSAYSQILGTFTNADQTNLSDLSGSDYFNRLYKNYINIHDDITSKTQSLQDSATKPDLVTQFVSEDDLLAVQTGFVDAAIQLKGYYNLHLNTLMEITTTPIWNDYVKIQMKDMSDQDYQEKKKAYGFHQNAVDAGTRMLADYKAVAVKLNCK